MIKYVFMDSEYCSMGRWISMIMGDVCGMKLYEGIDLAELSDEEWLTKAYLNDFDNRIAGKTAAELTGDEEFQRVNTALLAAAKKAIAQGPCIIHERALGALLGDTPDSMRVLLYNKSMEHRIPRAVGDPTFDLKEATHDEVVQFICDQDADRAAYRNALTDKEWGVKESYDLCLDSDLLGREKCAEILIEAVSDLTLDAQKCKAIIDRIMEKWADNHR